MSYRNTKKNDSILPNELKDVLPSKSGTSFGWNYFTCVNVGMCIISSCALVIITVFVILLWKSLGVIEYYQREIAPNVATIAAEGSGGMLSYKSAISQGQWTLRGVVNSVYPRDDLEMNEYARTGKSIVSSAEIILSQIIEREVFKMLQHLQPFLTKLDPDEVDALVHFTFTQMENGNLDALIEMLVDKRPGSLRNILAEVDAMGLDAMAGTLNSPKTKKVMDNVGVWAERFTEPTQIDKIMKVTQLLDDMHETRFVNRTSETLGFVNRILGSGVGIAP